MTSIHQDQLRIQTSGRGFTELTESARQFAHACQVHQGLLTVFMHHTSASLILCENADEQVLRDLEGWMQRAIPDGDPIFRHTAEGPDDMPAHVRSVLTASSLSLPVVSGRLDLGTWQGLYLYEHRVAPHRRRVSLTLIGED
ncbi:MAG: secondary thiamine-phosphate synthase [Planctomycetes bacterium]|nr:secondary thiamine-phosphate synthase [Planctomycetota bacterium]